MKMLNEVLKNSKLKDSDLVCKDIKNIPECEVCGEPTGKLVKTAFGSIIGSRACKCKREKWNKEQEEDLNRQKQANLKRVISNSMMNSKFRKCTFKNWDHFMGNEKLYKAGLRYVNNFPRYKLENKGFVIHGDPGNGKTYFSACIANALINKLIPVICVGAIALIERISQSKQTWGEEGIFTVLNSLENADLLIIDDLGTEPDNKWTRSMVYQIIEKRCSTQLPTIITTNISIEELKVRYDDRTYSRLVQMCSFIRNTGEDLRKLEGKEKTKELLNELLGED